MAAKVTVRDRGYKALMRRMSPQRSKATLTVGVHEDKGSQQHPSGNVTVAEVAAFHELGLGQTQRSIVAEWADENDGEMRESMRRAGRDLIKGRDATMASALDEEGKRAAQSMRSRLEGGLSPAEQDDGDGGDPRPVIESGAVLDAIDYKVTR